MKLQYEHKLNLFLITSFVFSCVRSDFNFSLNSHMFLFLEFSILHKDLKSVSWCHTEMLCFVSWVGSRYID